MLSGEQVHHFGAYLVCQVARWRYTTRHRTFSRFGELGNSIANDLRGAETAPDGDLAHFARRADSSLQEMRRIVDSWTPHVTRERLEFFYLRLDGPLGAILPPLIGRFLRMLCDHSDSGWRTCRSLAHDVSHDLSDLGGLLFDAFDESSSVESRHRFATEAIQSARLFAKEAEYMFRGLDGGLGSLTSYIGCEYHAEAVRLMRSMAQRALQHAPADSTVRGLVEWDLKRAEQLLVTSGPHLTPFLDALERLLPREEVESFILEDEAVSNIRECIQGRQPRAGP